MSADDRIIDTASVRSVSGPRPKAVIAPIAKPGRKNDASKPVLTSQTRVEQAAKENMHGAPKAVSSPHKPTMTDATSPHKVRVASPLRSPSRQSGGNPFLRTRRSPQKVSQDTPQRMDISILKESLKETQPALDPWSRKESGASAMYRWNTPLRSEKNVSTNTSDSTGTRNFLQSLIESEAPGQEDDNSELVVPGLVPMLLKHQVRGVKFLVKRENTRKCRGGLLCDSMGLGKTVQTIALILREAPPKDATVKTTLVVVPLAVLSQWKEEIELKAPKLKVTTHQGASRTANYAELAEYDVVITTYDVVKSEFDVKLKAGSEAKETKPNQKQALYSGSWYRVVLDEAHTIRNGATVGAKAVVELKSSGRRWCLTGTPVHNSILDFVPLLRFIEVPDVDDATFKKLSDVLNAKIDVPEDSPVLRAFRKALSPVMLARNQRVLHSQLPKIKREVVPVQLSESEMQGLSAVGHITLMRLGADGLLQASGPPSVSKAEANKALKLNDEVDLTDLLSGMSIAEKKINPSENAKCQALLEILSKEPGRKTVVFSSFLRMLDWIEPALKANNITYRKFFGGTKQAERQRILSEYKDPNKDIQVLLCTLQCASVGLNITAASQVVMMDPWWNPQITDQAVGRVHRLGQKREVNCYELVAQGTIEERMMTLLKRKRQLASSLMQPDKLTKEEREFLMYGDS